MTGADVAAFCTIIVTVSFVIGFLFGCVHASNCWEKEATKRGFVRKQHKLIWVADGTPCPPHDKDTPPMTRQSTGEFEAFRELCAQAACCSCRMGLPRFGEWHEFTFNGDARPSKTYCQGTMVRAVPLPQSAPTPREKVK